MLSLPIDVDGEVVVVKPSSPEPSPKNVVSNMDPLEEECDRLTARSMTAIGAREVLPRLKELTDLHPNALKPALAYAVVREATRNKEGMFEVWCDLHRRFPTCDKALRFRVRWLKRLHREDEGRALIEEYYPGTPESSHALQEKAELHGELGDVDSLKRYYRKLITRFPEDPRGRFHFAKRLREYGEGFEAWRVLEPVFDHPQMPKSGVAFVNELRAGLETLRRIAPDRCVEGTDTNILAYTCAIDLLAAKREDPPRADVLGRVALITGSLGAGGAERQLARTASRLELARAAGVDVAGVPLDDSFHVVVKSLDSAAGHDFFLGPVEAAKVPTHQIDDMPPVPYEQLQIDDPQVASLLPFLPPNAAYGVQRMFNYFRREKIRVAYIWQDGAVLFAALAAMLAGVPRVVLTMRGLPPIMRLHLHRPEYTSMYRALANAPGVVFASNSRAAAVAYCDWIGMRRDRFTIVYNGVDNLPPEGGESEIKRWESFERRTGGPGVPTIGSVFRFDTDKRPHLWIDFAAAYHARHPEARYVLVGGGRMLAEAREKATAYGIADRILFVGASKRVGYWLRKMETFVLLSMFEGLPNAIIEAQLTGVPVVSTPAGGVGEALKDGETGLLLSTVDPLDLAELCDKVETVHRWKLENPGLGDKIVAFAEHRFSTEAMIENTALLLSGRQENKDD